MESRNCVRGQGARWMVCVGLAMALVGAALPARAANTCPWMNEATASGLLGAEATGSFTAAAAQQPASCVFTENSPGITRTLTITMEINQDWSGRMRDLLRECHDAPDAMRAIGNEAQTCVVMRPRGAHAELVVGRVRDQVFSIAIGTTVKNDPVLRPDELQNRIAVAAEQVAGNLF